MRIPGKVKGTSKEVFVTFSGAGATTTVKKPVEMDDSGSSGTITVPADKEEEFVQKLIADHARKGNQVIVERAGSLGSEAELDFGFDVLLLKRAMAKVAFLAAVYGSRNIFRISAILFPKLEGRTGKTGVT